MSAPDKDMIFRNLSMLGCTRWCASLCYIRWISSGFRKLGSEKHRTNAIFAVSFVFCFAWSFLLLFFQVVNELQKWSEIYLFSFLSVFLKVALCHSKLPLFYKGLTCNRSVEIQLRFTAHCHICKKKMFFDPRAYCKGDIPTHSFKNRTNLINLGTFYYFKESHAMKNGRNDWSVRMW